MFHMNISNDQLFLIISNNTNTHSHIYDASNSFKEVKELLFLTRKSVLGLFYDDKTWDL